MLTSTQPKIWSCQSYVMFLISQIGIKFGKDECCCKNISTSKHCFRQYTINFHLGSLPRNTNYFNLIHWYYHRFFGDPSLLLCLYIRVNIRFELYLNQEYELLRMKSKHQYNNRIISDYCKLRISKYNTRFYFYQPKEARIWQIIYMHE